MLSAEQRQAFDETGIVRLPGAIDLRTARDMVDAIWAFAEERFGARRDDPDTWMRYKPSLLRALRDRDAFAPMATPTIRAFLDELFGAGAWNEPEHWGQLLLLRSPWAGPDWVVPHQAWHLDFMPIPGLPRLIGVQLFACLGTLAPRAGGTLVVSGSHRLVAASPTARRSAEARKELRRRVPWLNELWSPAPEGQPAEARVERFMDEAHAVDDAQLRVVELTGDAGDVIAVHPWTFHTGTANGTDQPRLVLTERIWSRSGSPA